MGIKVYTRPDCIYCNMVKKYLNSKDVIYCEIDVTCDSAAAADMTARSGQRTVPVIDFDGTIVVGFDKDRIDSLL